jgi:outer membrane protein TolC
MLTSLCVAVALAPRSADAAPGAATGASSAGTGTPAAPLVRPAPSFAELSNRLRERVARPGGLTSDAAARRALQTSPEDRSRAADVDVAAAEVSRADVGYYPKLTLSARYTRLSPVSPPVLGLVAAPANQGLGDRAPLAGEPLFARALSFPVVLDNYALQANVTVPLSDYLLRIRQSHDAALSSQEAAEMTRQATRRTVAAQAKLLYYSWARLSMQELVTAQSVEQARRHVELAQAGKDAGRTPEVDVMRAESAVASAELLHERTRNAAIVAEERLRTLLHEPSTVPYAIGEDILSPLPAESAADPDALFSEALEKRPEMRAFERSDASLKEQRSATRSTGLPRLDAFGNGYVANPSQRIFPQREEWRATWDVGVQLTWSPNDTGTTDAAMHSIDAKRRKLDADRAAVKDALRDEIRAALIASKEAIVAAETASRGLAAAEESYRVRRELFELGRATDVEWLDAETDVLRARLEMIQARVDARVAHVQLVHAVGRDVFSR